MTYKGKQLYRHAITYALTGSSYKMPCSKTTEPIHLVKGTFLEQSSGKKVEGIEGIQLNIPHHTAILIQEQKIFESLANFYR